MKKSGIIITLLLTIWVHPIPAQSLEPDPGIYHVAFENEYVTVYEVVAAPGTISPPFHTGPAVWLSLSKARFEFTGPDGSVRITDMNPAEIFWVDRADEGWELLYGTAHFFIIDIKQPGNGQVSDPLDSVRKDPVHHHVLFENDYVRVYEGVASAGAVSTLHSHPPTVLISLTKSRFRVQSGDETWIFDFYPSQVYWVGHFQHSWEILAGDAHVFGIEVKSAQQGDTR
jgi:hypothetical protein